MYLGLEPSNLQKTVLQIHSISDEIWYIAGDKSVDVRIIISHTYSTHGTPREHYCQGFTSRQSSICLAIDHVDMRQLGNSSIEGLAMWFQADNLLTL